jgi:hypothetical protein
VKTIFERLSGKSGACEALWRVSVQFGASVGTHLNVQGYKEEGKGEGADGRESTDKRWGPQLLGISTPEVHLLSVERPGSLLGTPIPPSSPDDPSVGPSNCPNVLYLEAAL